MCDISAYANDSIQCDTTQQYTTQRNQPKLVNGRNIEKNAPKVCCDNKRNSTQKKKERKENNIYFI